MKFDNISIKGIVSAIPRSIEKNLEYPHLDPAERSKLTSAIGILERRVAPENLHSSDLCIAAAQELLIKLAWEKDSVDLLIFITQTPDHVIPSTSHIIQHKLGLKKDLFCFDVNEGCAGYVYGLSLTGKLLDGKDLKRCLLLVGDTVSKIIAKGDHSNTMLFGDCGTATALEFKDDVQFSSYFDLYSDGSGKNAIIVEQGSICSRGVSKGEALQGKSFLSLKGTDVFLFALKEVPKAIEKFLNHYGIDQEKIDHFCLHQANKMINDGIAKKLKISHERFLNSIEKFGNTSSASIPLSICQNSYSDQLSRHMILCGFGVGLSWGVGNFLFEGNNYSVIEC
jgi:3-oxoacyl-[acyl-carrier-protein] synthase-3